MKVVLKASHLCLDAELAAQLFDNSPYAFLAYKEEEQQLLLSPVTNSWFPKLHQAQQYFLKVKNQAGDVATALHALILDHDLDESDRDLDFSLNQKSQFIKINLK